MSRWPTRFSKNVLLDGWQGEARRGLSRRSLGDPNSVTCAPHVRSSVLAMSGMRRRPSRSGCAGDRPQIAGLDKELGCHLRVGLAAVTSLAICVSCHPGRVAVRALPRDGPAPSLIGGLVPRPELECPQDCFAGHRPPDRGRGSAGSVRAISGGVEVESAQRFANDS
jgi:hypothetical protein